MLKTIPLARIRESAHNPRKHFDAAAMTELVASVTRSGVLEPVVVRGVPRDLPNEQQHYELASGHRRFRAAQAAGLTEIPAYVRDLDDAAFYELLTVANLQRTDVHALDEAEAYAEMMTTLGWDVGQIAARLGKSERYVYDRLKFRALIAPARACFYAGRITAGHAIELSRLGPDAQERVMEPHRRALWERDSSHGDEDLDLDLEADNDPLAAYQGYKPRTVGELRAWIEREVRFDPREADPVLFPELVATVKAAQEEALKVVHITREDKIADGAKADGQRTYSQTQWRRADGQPESEANWRHPQVASVCDHGVLGVVVAGPGRGEAFTVCVAAKKCRTHWPEAFRAAEQASDPEGDAAHEPPPPREESPWEAERRKREAKVEAVRRAIPAITEAFVAAVQAANVGGTGPLVPMILETCELREPFDTVDTASDLVRSLAWEQVSSALESEYQWANDGLARLGKTLGVDVRALVKAAQPKPEKKAKPAAAPVPATKTKAKVPSKSPARSTRTKTR